MHDHRAVTALIREDFYAFLFKAFNYLHVGQTFGGNWHLEAIIWKLESARTRGGARLIVNVPPRSLKSITISVAWVAWMLGKDPSLKFICISYSNDLSAKLARDCRALMQSDFYGRAFPNTRLVRGAEHDLTTTAMGGRVATSVTGTLTGKGGDFIIIDDPIKPDEALSEAVRKSINEWFGSTVTTRLDDKARGSIILVMQRVHEEDLSGFLLEGGGWDHLSLPAICPAERTYQLGPDKFHKRRVDDLLHAAREPRHILDELRRSMGSLLFEAQFQQDPLPAAGMLIKRDWLRRYSPLPEPIPGDRWVQSWDCASKDGVMNDFSVCITAMIRKRDIYIADVFRQKLQFPDLYRHAVRLAERNHIDALLIEDAASGTQLIQVLREKKPTAVPRPLARKPEGDKLSRMSGASHRIEAGEVFLPENSDWLAVFERELLGFPNYRHDDQVDALAQLLKWASDRPGDSTPVGPRSYSGDGSGPVFDPYDDEDDDPGRSKYW